MNYNQILTYPPSHWLSKGRCHLVSRLGLFHSYSHKCHCLQPGMRHWTVTRAVAWRYKAKAPYVQAFFPSFNPSVRWSESHDAESCILIIPSSAGKMQSWFSMLYEKSSSSQTRQTKLNNGWNTSEINKTHAFDRRAWIVVSFNHVRRGSSCQHLPCGGKCLWALRMTMKGIYRIKTILSVTYRIN